MVGPKKQDFLPRVNVLKGFFFKSFAELWFVKKCQNRFKVNFRCQKLIEFFSKTFFSKLNFLTTFIQRLYPIFVRFFSVFFPWWYVDSWLLFWVNYL